MISNKELISIYQLKSIVRYNNKPKLTKETVAEHSFYVALISLIVCDKLKLPPYDKYQALTKALLHDMPEIEINDITHDVKEKLKLDEFLAKYENAYYKKHFVKYVGLMQSTDSLVDTIVNYADAASVKQYCLHEMNLGNKSKVMKTIYNDAKHRMNKYCKMIENILIEGARK